MYEHMTYGLTCSSCGHFDSYVNADHHVVEQYPSSMAYLAHMRAAGWQAPDQPHTKPLLCPKCFKTVQLQQTQ